MITVCTVSLSYEIKMTDSNGRANFSDILIPRGPQGQYALVFSSKYKGIEYLGDPIHTVLTSSVAKLEILNLPPFSYDLTIDPLDPKNNFISQPVLRVLDINGNPLQGKYITAFTWPEPQMNFMGSAYDIDGNKIFPKRI